MNYKLGAVSAAAPAERMEWIEVPLSGAWMPDGFVGRFCNLQRNASGEDAVLVSSVEDAWGNMALVEAAYNSSASPATPIEGRPSAS